MMNAYSSPCPYGLMGMDEAVLEDVGRGQGKGHSGCVME